MRKIFNTTLLILILFLLGTFIRLYDLTDEPLEVAATRQLRSAIIARGYYFQNNQDLSQEEIKFALTDSEDAGLLELPLLAWYSSLVYRLLGQEIIWVGKVISTGFWMLGAAALYLFTKDITSKAGGIASLVYYLFLPFGMTYSRVLMPDPMMTAMTVIAIWSLYNWEKKRNTGWAVATGLFTGYAILTKSIIAFVLLPPFALFILVSLGWKAAARNKQVWTIAILAAIPNIAFYVYGFFIDTRLASEFGLRFFPELWIDPSFYVRWMQKIEFKFELVTFFISFIGIALLKEKKLKALFFGWWLGYFVYGLVSPYHIWTHVYYHLPLVPLIAACLAPLGQVIDEKIQTRKNKIIEYSLILAALAVVVVYNSWQFRVDLARKDYRVEPPYWQMIGDVFEDYPEEKVYALVPDYGSKLSYYGNQDVTTWLRAGDLLLRSLGGQTITFEDQWQTTEGHRFFLVTGLNNFSEQTELKTRLENDYEVFILGEDFIVFDLEAEK